MRCKIVRFQKLVWRNMIKSTKIQKASVLHYSIDYNNGTPIPSRNSNLKYNLDSLSQKANGKKIL